MIGKNKLAHMNIPLIIQNKTFKYYYIGDYLIIFNTKIIFKEQYWNPKPRNHVLQVHIWLRGCPQSKHLI